MVEVEDHDLARVRVDPGARGVEDVGERRRLEAVAGHEHARVRAADAQVEVADAVLELFEGVLERLLRLAVVLAHAVVDEAADVRGCPSDEVELPPLIPYVPMSWAPGIVSSVNGIAPISLRRSLIQFVRRTSLVGRDAAVPDGFVNSARNALPTAKALVGSVVEETESVVDVAPGMSDHGPLRLAATCHWTVGAGVPAAAALSCTTSPAAATSARSGELVTTGASGESADAVDTATSMATAMAASNRATPRLWQHVPGLRTRKPSKCLDTARRARRAGASGARLGA